MKQHYQPEDPRATRAKAAVDFVIRLAAGMVTVWAVLTLALVWYGGKP